MTSSCSLETFARLSLDTPLAGRIHSPINGLHKLNSILMVNLNLFILYVICKILGFTDLSGRIIFRTPVHKTGWPNSPNPGPFLYPGRHKPGYQLFHTLE